MRTTVLTDSLDHAVADLYREQRLAMLRLAVFLVDDRGVAEDLVQDAFTQLYRRWGSLSDPAAAVAYLRTCVVNAARSVYRRRDTARRHLKVAEPDLSPDTDYALLLAEEHREVLEALRTLPRRQREVLVLRFWCDLNEADIARTLNVSRGTVKSTASRGLDALRTRLEGTR